MENRLRDFRKFDMEHKELQHSEELQPRFEQTRCTLIKWLYPTAALFPNPHPTRNNKGLLGLFLCGKSFLTLTFHVYTLPMTLLSYQGTFTPPQFKGASDWNCTQLSELWIRLWFPLTDKLYQKPNTFPPPFLITVLSLIQYNLLVNIPTF